MKILILTGGTRCRHAGEIIRNFHPEHVICADSGIRHAVGLGLPIDQILGDFDSVYPELLEEVRRQHLPEQVFPSEKDDTDTELALHTAMELPGDDHQILLMAAMGTRMDHTLANILLLKQAADRQVPCRIVDDDNVIEMLKGPAQMEVRPELFPWHAGEQMYVSLLPVFSDASGVTLKGFYYPLQDGTIPAGVSLGISNQLTAGTGTISLREGYLLIMRAFDA